VVNFASSQYTVVEAYADMAIAMTISEIPTEQLLVYAYVTPVTATPGFDFVEGLTYARFEPAASDTSYLYVQIYSDTEPEGPETILLTIYAESEYYTPGSTGEATLTIIDDDSDTPTAHFEIAEDIPLDPNGHIAVVTGPDAPVLVDVVVDDLPPGGASINYTSTADGQIHTLAFTFDPRQSIEVPAADIPPGAAHAVNELQILNPAGKRSSRSDHVSAHSIAFDMISLETVQCLACQIRFIFDMFDELFCEDSYDICGYYCGDKAAAGQPEAPGAPESTIDPGADFETLQRYRDEILLGSPVGDYYIQLYRDYSLAIGTAILQRPTLIYRVAETWDLWLPAVGAQVDGQGASFTITGEMQTALLDIMTEFEEVGSPELAELLGEFRTELDLEHVAGTTAADLQESIETNSMGNEWSSWGDVKSMFR